MGPLPLGVLGPKPEGRNKKREIFPDQVQLLQVVRRLPLDVSVPHGEPVRQLPLLVLQVEVLPLVPKQVLVTTRASELLDLRVEEDVVRFFSTSSFTLAGRSLGPRVP